MIGCSALAQSPIEAASVPADEVTPRFADLVLLVNPRSSAHATCQYMILRKSGHSQAESAPNLPFSSVPRPLTIGPRDWPLPSATPLPAESYLDRRERQTMINTIGHLPWFKTHDLIGDSVLGDTRSPLLLRQPSIRSGCDTRRHQRPQRDIRRSLPQICCRSRLRACRIFPLEDTEEQNDQALLDARQSAKRVHGNGVPPG
jgi:hypothetical protein